MKKFTICLLLACLLSLVPLQAAAAVKATVKASEVTAEPGEEVTFTVSIQEASEVRGIGVLPVYDKETFTLVSGSWLLSGIITDFDTEKAVGVIAFTDPTQVNGQALTFTLRVKDDAATGQYTIGSEVVISDAKGQRNEMDAVTTKLSVEGGKTPDREEPAKPTATKPAIPKPTKPSTVTQTKPTTPSEATPTKPAEPAPTQPQVTQDTNPTETTGVQQPQTQPEETSPTQPQPTPAPEKTEDKPETKWIWGGIIAAAWLIAALVVIVLKKTKT